MQRLRSVGVSVIHSSSADDDLVGGFGSSWRGLVPLWCPLTGWLGSLGLVTAPLEASAFQHQDGALPQ